LAGAGVNQAMGRQLVIAGLDNVRSLTSYNPIDGLLRGKLLYIYCVETADDKICGTAFLFPKWNVHFFVPFQNTVQIVLQDRSFLCLLYCEIFTL
jgi:hypothetical protein